MFKKSQSISINTIIVAAIALAVLVVLFMIFTGRFKIFSEGVKGSDLSCNDGCKIAGYASGSSSSDSCNNRLVGSYRDVDPQKNEVCCCLRTSPVVDVRTF